MWQQCSLINLFGWPNKFFADNHFSKTIIGLNKEKIYPSVNLKIDKFFRKIIEFNILTLYKSKKIIAQVTKATRHRNWHIVIEIYNDVIYMVKLFIAEKAFKEILSYNLRDNGKITNTIFF